ncbi:hypothetical protein D1871_04590 [Nakamurella silvestris]|nr:hypothetical protein D1871_04590 [Nakamurella silvestris]
MSTRVMFSKSRASGVLMGMSAPQLAVGAVALFLVIQAVNSPDNWGWWVLAAVLTALTIILRFAGRPLAAVGPALVVEGVMRMFGLTKYRGGPARKDDRPEMVGQPQLPGDLSRLRFSSYRISDAQPAVGIITDTADGHIMVILEVEGEGYLKVDQDVLDMRARAFQSMLDATARGNEALVCLQILHRVIPDQGDESHRELRRRGGLGNRFVREANQALVNAHADTGVRHESYVVLRIDPKKDPASVKDFGRGPEAAAALAVRQFTSIGRHLQSCGVKVKGWVPERGIAAILRSAYDPASDRMVARRGGGHGDTTGGDGGLPSGVAPTHAGPMFAQRAMTYYRHNDHYTRTFWVQEWPRSREGVAIGFLMPLILGLGIRHTVSLVFKPIPPQKAKTKLNREIDSADTRGRMNSRIRGRVSREDRRERADVDRKEAEQVDGHTSFSIAGLVSVTSPSRQELEIDSAAVESAMNESNLECQRFIIETDQAFVMAALPLARGLV